MHYGKEYFAWQKEIGKMGGRLDKFKFEPYIRETDTVLDFGCGGGWILGNLNCERKIGIEINRFARKTAKGKNGIEVYEDIDSVPDNTADIIISNHALEHVKNPYGILVKLLSKLKESGTIIFVVPSERKTVYKRDDINMHLYTWSGQNIGNLFRQAGYYVEDVKEIRHFWPPAYQTFYKIFGEKFVFVLACIWARLHPKTTQIRVIAKK